MPENTNRDFIKAMSRASQLSSIPIELGVCVWLGYLADQRLGSNPLFLTIGCVLGLAVSLFHLWMLVLAIRRDSSSSSGKS